jgi:uncharacterized membrane protein
VIESDFGRATIDSRLRAFCPWRIGLRGTLCAPVIGLMLLFAAAGGEMKLQSQAPAQTKKPATGPAAPQSTHYPILLLAFGNEPSWSLRIAQKGPERLDRPGYPPIALDPMEVSREGAADAWSYRARDTAAGADVTVRLTRETCSDSTGGVKSTFRAVVQHSQIGTLNGCARIAAELFPRISNQTDDDEDKPQKKPPEVIINFKPPVATAFVNAAGKVIVSIGAIKKVAASSGSELALSRDGRKLLYTRSDSKTGPERTIVLYEFTTGRSQDLVHGAVRQAFWSPDDSRVAFLNYQDQNWQIWAFPYGSPGSAAPLYANDVAALHGWVDAHTLLASDMQNAYWIAEDGRIVQAVALHDLYGPAFQIMGSDRLLLNPINADLLLVSANYAVAPTGAPTDSMGIAAGIFLFELRSKRRVTLTPTDQWARNGEWSRDGIQVFYSRRLSATSFATYRVFWDGSGVRRYLDGSDLVVGQ